MRRGHGSPDRGGQHVTVAAFLGLKRGVILPKKGLQELRKLLSEAR